MSEPLPDFIEQAFPERGPCAFCGDPDARHRIFDAITDYIDAGEPTYTLAQSYGVSEQVVVWLKENRP